MQKAGASYASLDLLKGSTEGWPTPGISASGGRLKSNIKQAWWKKFVPPVPPYNGAGFRHSDESPRYGGVRSRGHFSDPLMDCKLSFPVSGADPLAEGYAKEHGLLISPDGMSSQELEAFTLPNQRSPAPSAAQERLYQHPEVQFDVPHPYRGSPRTAPVRFTSGLRPPRVSLSTSKACCGPAGKAALRHRPDRQSFRQRDYPRQLIFRIRGFEQMELGSSACPVKT